MKLTEFIRALMFGMLIAIFLTSVGIIVVTIVKAIVKAAQWAWQ